jgi:hypothetical protein
MSDCEHQRLTVVLHSLTIRSESEQWSVIIRISAFNVDAISKIADG